MVRYPVRIMKKKKVLSEAAKANIELGSWFECPLHPIETPTRMDIELLSYLQHKLKSGLISADLDVDAQLQKLRQDSDLFLKIPDTDWTDFAYRHGKIPVIAEPAGFVLDVNLSEETIDTKQYSWGDSIIIREMHINK